MKTKVIQLLITQLLYSIMQTNPKFDELIVVGGGPVGNFVAVLAGMLGVPCFVYEKRNAYTREINLKIEKNFFRDVGNTMNKISRRNSTFFQELNDAIQSKNGKIVLKDLQIKLQGEALRMGAKYFQKQIKTFQQADELHRQGNPLVLDCAGRNSPLRINYFGNDQQNMKVYNLHHALHINFKAHAPGKFNFQLLYPVIKNSENLKLGEVIISKDKHDPEAYYSHVTVPLFISQELSAIIDQKYPQINRVPLRLFSTKVEEQTLVKEVQEVVSSLFCALVMQDWDIEWLGVVIKKINITCGYGIKRSSNRYICLGDSAAHFAYFKSLNFGLRHAFDLIKILASYHSVKYELGPFDEKLIVDRCWKKNPYLWPTHARQGPSPCTYFVTTAQLKILAPYIYNITDDSASRIDLMPQIKQQKIEQKFGLYQSEVRQKDWERYLLKFENIRKFAIDMEIFSNVNKKNGAEVISYFIWLNGLSPIKLSQTISFISKGYYLDKKDFDYFNQNIQSMKACLGDWPALKAQIKHSSLEMSKVQKLPPEYDEFIRELIRKCGDESTTRSQICGMILNSGIQAKGLKMKKPILFLKILMIAAYVTGKHDEASKKMHEQIIHV